MRCVAIGSSADAGSSISRISGWIASARAMQSRCCWPPDKRQRRLVQPILDLVPERGRLQALLDARRAAPTASRARPLMRRPYATFSKIDLGNGLDFWNTIPTRRRSAHDVAPGAIDVAAVDQHLAFDARARDDVVHPVQRAQERALAAAGRPDECGDDVRLDADRDVLERALRAVVEIQARGRR